MKHPGPYILTADDDGHWYVIPAECNLEFEIWVGKQEFEPDGLPEWADRIGGSHTLVEFPSYSITTY